MWRQVQKRGLGGGVRLRVKGGCAYGTVRLNFEMLRGRGGRRKATSRPMGAR